MKIHIISETEFIMKATGVHTAFIDHLELLKEKNDIDVIVNEQGKGDILHSHTYGPYYFWKGRHYKGRRVFTAHVIPDSIKGSLPFWKLFMPFIKLGLKTVYSYSDVCIAISPMVEKAIKESGADTRIIKIYNPVHHDLWKRTNENKRKGRERLGINENEFIVLGVGQLIGRKGIEDFINIADAIPEIRFVWAGGRPFKGLTEGINRINERIKNAGNNFLYAGEINLNDMPAIYAAADLMIFPSYQENCPLAPIEAAACGMPVIYRDIPEYKYLYEKPYLKASDNKEFIELTQRMISDKDFYEEGLRISEQLLYQFDKDIIRRKLINIYSELCENSSPSIDFSNTYPDVSLGIS